MFDSRSYKLEIGIKDFDSYLCSLCLKYRLTVRLQIYLFHGMTNSGDKLYGWPLSAEKI